MKLFIYLFTAILHHNFIVLDFAILVTNFYSYIILTDLLRLQQ
jgi:hypothetical protein